MVLTDVVILLLCLLLLGWAIYDDVVIDRLKSPTLLSIPLLRRNRVDSIIFVGLLCILLYNNLHARGPLITTWLLGVLMLIVFYLFWIKRPQIRFKQAGFFFGGFWFDYSRISAMNLSEDGVLVFQMGERRLLIRVHNIDDLEAIYNFLLKNQ